MRGDGDVLMAPCLLCGYNGVGYWQAGTHHDKCLWRTIGGEAERRRCLGPFLETLTALRDENATLRQALAQALIALTAPVGAKEPQL
jgi:hypothetical protein